MKKFTLITLLLVITTCFSQEIKDVPNFKFLRAEENYSYLKDTTNNYKKNYLDGLKLLPLNKQKSLYATIGGEIRPRMEHFTNKKWTSNRDETYYSQRLSLHANLVLGKHFRVFTELYNGYTSDEKKIVQYDELSFHQAFVEIKFPFNNNNSKSSLRIGRQEMSLGASRMINMREGPNIRRSFDAVKATYKKNNTTLNLFYAKETFPSFYAFDNNFTLFNDKGSNPKLYGIYSQFKIKGLQGKNELYYLGFGSNFSKFNDVSGKEKRHTVGFRRLNSISKHLSFNTEIMYQFGDLGSAKISAFNIDIDTHYKLINSKWSPGIGLKLNWSSGDKNKGDQKLNTFNPLFVSATFSGLSGYIVPINLISIHPTISIKPVKKLTILTDWGIFWRATKNDGLYAPPGILIRENNKIENKYIGNQFGLRATYKMNRNFTFNLDTSYFIAGGFLEKSGTSENIFYISPKISYKF